MGSGKLIFLGGINGVGKTTFLSELEKDDHFEILYGSKLLMEWLGIEMGDYDTLRSLPQKSTQKELDKMVRYWLKHSSDKEFTVFSGHFIDFKEGKLEYNVGDWIAEFDLLTHLVADPKIIVERIDADSRDRKNLPEGLNKKEKAAYLKEYQELSLEEMRRFSKQYDIPMILVNNNDSISKVVKEFIKAIGNANNLSF